MASTGVLTGVVNRAATGEAWEAEELLVLGARSFPMMPRWHTGWGVYAWFRAVRRWSGRSPSRFVAG